MATRWNRYFEQQQEDPEMKDLVEQELIGNSSTRDGHCPDARKASPYSNSASSPRRNERFQNLSDRNWPQEY